MYRNAEEMTVFQPDSQNIFAVKSLSNRERKAPVKGCQVLIEKLLKQEARQLCSALVDSRCLETVSHPSASYGGSGQRTGTGTTRLPNCAKATFSFPHLAHFSAQCSCSTSVLSLNRLRGPLCITDTSEWSSTDGYNYLHHNAEHGMKRASGRINRVTYNTEQKSFYFVPAAFVK